MVPMPLLLMVLQMMGPISISNCTPDVAPDPSPDCAPENVAIDVAPNLSPDDASNGAPYLRCSPQSSGPDTSPMSLWVEVQLTPGCHTGGSLVTAARS